MDVLSSYLNKVMPETFVVFSGEPMCYWSKNYKLQYTHNIIPNENFEDKKMIIFQ